MGKIYIGIIFLLLILFNCGCKKFLTVRAPKEQLITPTFFENDSIATDALIGIYETWSSRREYFPSGNQSVTLLAGLSADELDNYSETPERKQYYSNEISATNSINWNLWWQLYRSIYQCNFVLEALNASPLITTKLKQQLSGEALFLRAFSYFYLVNLYGQVPLALTTDYHINDTLHRSPIITIYEQIKNDLIFSIFLLTDEYASGTERIRANRAAANALLARVCLLRHDWKQSISRASLVIDRINQYQLCGQLNDVFLKNSSEAILQLQPTLASYNTFDAEMFILNGAPTLVACSRQLLSAFEPNDMRMANWIASVRTGNDTFYFPYKYKLQTGNTVQEYLMLLRLGELYLIRAEAYAQLGMRDSALVDLNTIRRRAGLESIHQISIDSVLQSVYKERQVEFFSEWGHRWLDLKRTRRADNVLSVFKFPGWKSWDTLYPIPQKDISLNPNLTQNVGY